MRGLWRYRAGKWWHGHDIVVSMSALRFLSPSSCSHTAHTGECGPVFHTQVRMGLGRRSLRMLKFRAMAWMRNRKVPVGRQPTIPPHPHGGFSAQSSTSFPNLSMFVRRDEGGRPRRTRPLSLRNSAGRAQHMDAQGEGGITAGLKSMGARRLAPSRNEIIRPFGTLKLVHRPPLQDHGPSPPGRFLRNPSGRL